MREELAEQLLGTILGWEIEIAKEEIANLRFLAAVKYDEYRNFAPGFRFLESLGLWLRNFKTLEERQAAYQFMKNRMIYISESQMDHLVGILYPQRVIPIFLQQASKLEKLDLNQVRRIKNSIAYSVLRRKTLFIGMSDGARMDAFRRKHLLSNEQVCVSYELSEQKLQSLHADLEKWIVSKAYSTEGKFENIFLIDDFSGSSNSMLRSNDGLHYKGKFVKFIKELFGEGNKFGKYCRENGPNIFIVMYVATNKAIKNLEENLEQFLKNGIANKINTCEILPPLQLLEDKVKIPRHGDQIDLVFEQLLIQYYDDRLHDEHTATGGDDVIHGYANCSLPLVLCHNCPNNSVYLFWGETEKLDTRPGLKALFPRISRHLESRD